MTTASRFDIYAPIHKALRLFMMDTLQRLGRLDLDDPCSLNAGLGQLDELLTAAASHLQHENDAIHPALEARQPGASQGIAGEHQEHLDAIAALRRQAAALRAEPGAAAAHRLYRQLAAFVAENFEHMDVEETRHNPLLWAHCSDAEIQAIEHGILAGLGAPEMTMWLGWMLRAFNAAERAQLVNSLPPEAQAPVLAQARSLLDDGAWARLCGALGRAPVPGLVAA